MENSDWYDHVVAGIQYLKTALNGRKRPDVFTNELTYNLIALSLEKLLMGLCIHHGRLPQHHRLDGLVEEVATMEPIDVELVKNVQAVESYQDLCSFEIYKSPFPNDMEIKAMLKIAKEVEQFVKQSIERRNAALLKERSMLSHYARVYA